MGMATKMTFGEWVTVVLFGGTVAIVMFILFIPLGLISAWMRVKMWDWFAVPYFHLPHISVWLMFVVGMFISTFLVGQTPTLKKEFYDAGPVARVIVPIGVQWMAFFTAYLIHIWILKG